jgi:hypothetical protein
MESADIAVNQNPPVHRQSEPACIAHGSDVLCAYIIPCSHGENLR